MLTNTQQAVSVTSVPLSFFSILLTKLSSIGTRSDQSQHHLAPQIFTHWLGELRQRFVPLPDGTTRSVFRLLFPEQDIRRKYDLQEKLLGSYIGEIFGIPNDKLHRWNSAGASGCLGMELQRTLASQSSTIEDEKGLSIADVDELLDELASTSKFSHPSLRPHYPAPRSRKAILRHLYHSLSSIDVPFITQIILKDLRPFWSQPARLTLEGDKTSSCKPLCIEDAMRVWDPSGRPLEAYRLAPVIDDAMMHYQGLMDPREEAKVHVGVFIEIPKSKKGRGCSDALSYLRQSKRLWAETKYDGERAQIHVEILPAAEPKITIFSKSKRDSTQDRKAIHQIIRHAIQRKVKQNVVLDAEMVACNGNNVDEFCKIRGLLGDAASSPSGMSGVSTDQSLGLVFFDVLILDSRLLIHLPYRRRRALLESLIRTLPGHIFLAERTCIDLGEHPEENLQAVFAHSIANFEEGLILKAEESSYHDRNLPWVKLKKDYIPGFGDGVDLAILGARWDKDRGRELRVPPATYTTFFVGALMNRMELKVNPSSKPCFYLSTIASYGMSRKQLEELNFVIGNSSVLTYDSFKRSSGHLDYNIIFGLGLSMMPSVILKTPLLAELVGAGFTRPSGGEYYELRFPRITRVFRESERSWKDGIDLQQMQNVAYQCIGKDRPFKDVEDWCNGLWGKTASPSIKSQAKRKASAICWQNKLAILDQSNTSKKRPLSPSRKRQKREPYDSVSVSAPCIDNFEEVAKEAVVLRQLPNANVTNLIRCPGETSLAWFSEESRAKAIWKQITPPGHCLHTLESLLFGCGWCPTTPMQGCGLKWVENIEQGIAFVHDDRWKKRALETLSNYKAGTNPQARKPIMVIDIFEDCGSNIRDGLITIRSIQCIR